MSNPAPLQQSGFAPGREPAFPGAVIVVVSGVALMILLIWGPAFVTPKIHSGVRNSCQNNLKLLYICCMMYANENDDKSPKNLNDLYPEIMTDPNKFICPNSNDEIGDLNDIPTWSSYELVYSGPQEESMNQLIIREKRFDNHESPGRNCLYGDRHVEFMHLDQATKPAERAP